MGKSAALILVLVFLTAACITTPLPVKAEYNGNITINPNGTINPSTAPIKKTGNTYTLTSNLIGSITINSSNIALDGKGYTLLSDERDDKYGIVALINVSNVTVKNFIILHSEYKKTIGISLTDASNAIVANNTITGFDSIQAWNGGTYTGIYVAGGNSNTIAQNNLMNNLHGMEFLSSSYNLIVENNIMSGKTNGNGGLYTTGIYFAGRASNNTVYYNNFVNSTYLVKVSDSINVWDDGYLGNYWSNYKTKHPNAIQIDDSGTYNIPYTVDVQNVDRHPLTQPFSSEFYVAKIQPKISILSPVNQEFNESSVPLAFTVNKLSAWMSYSLDGQDNVTVAGNVTLSGLSNGLHNITVYAEDTFGNEGASETITFNVDVPEPFPVVPVAAVSVATAAVVGIGLLVYFKKRKR
jgi:parallel beta-helix repeat protein